MRIPQDGIRRFACRNEVSNFKRGSGRKIQVAIYPTGNGENRRWVFVAHDVTLEETLHGKYRSELSQKEGYISELEEARRKLEDYSKNLEKIVAQRTAQLRSANDSLNAMMNSLGQGFFTFNSAGQVGELYTRACLEILETSPQGKELTEVLRVTPDKSSEFKLWIKALFSEALPFDDLKPLGPTLFPHTKEKYITVDYYPIRAEGKLHDVVVVATDKTAERRAQLELERERQNAAMIIKYVKNKEQFLNFLKAAKQYLADVDIFASKPLRAKQITESFRIFAHLGRRSRRVLVARCETGRPALPGNSGAF